MGQTNIGIGGHAIPPQGTRGLGFDTQGRPVYIDAAGVPRLIGTDAAIDNVLASYGVGAEADLPAASAGLVYVTNDTYKIYSGVDTGVYDIRDLTAGQFVTDTYTPVRTTYQYIGTELMPVSGGALDVCSQADVEQAEPTENTKATSALRAWQGFVFWCKNTLFPELNTSDKTIVGSVNEIKTNVVKLETDETPASIADTDNVRFKSATGYFNRTLLAIKNYVKLGLKASEVANDSTIVLSPTVKAAFDNADCVAVTSLQDTDMIPFGRANGAVSENKMIPAIDAKSYFAPSPVLFNVTTTSELVTILGAPTCPYTVTINLLQEVELPAILNTYALNILFVGRKVIVSRNVAVNGMRPGVGVISFDVILLITDRAIITVSCFDFMSSFDMRFKDVLSNWVDTQYNLKLARGVDSMVSWGANNLISTKLSHDSGQPVIDNDYYVVTDTCGVTFVSDESAEVHIDTLRTLLGSQFYR